MTDGTEPVRIYAEEDFRLPRRLAVIFKDKIEFETGALAASNETFENMKWRQGYIAALNFALRECETADKELSGKR